jgi:hypothetical protein
VELLEQDLQLTVTGAETTYVLYCSINMSLNGGMSEATIRATREDLYKDSTFKT